MFNEQERESLGRRDFTTISVGSLSAMLAGCAGVLDAGDAGSGDRTEDEVDSTDSNEQDIRGEISSLEVTPTEAQQGEELVVTATVLNSDDVNHTGNIGVSVGQVSVFEDRISVEAGSSETRTVTTQQWQTGTYEVSVVLSANDRELDSAQTSVDIRTAHDNFVGVSGTDFVIDGDQVFYSGAHADGLSTIRTASNDEGAFEYEYEDEFDGDHYVADFMQYAASMNANVLRVVVAGVPYWENSTVHDGPGEFNDAWFELLDTVVAEAKRNEIRLVISLMSHDDTSAPAPGVYASWSDTVDDDLNADELNDAFFDDEQANEYYKNFIERVVTRENAITGIEYRDDPTIMMWECGNEIDYWTPENRGNSLADWYNDIATYIKSLDENHLVTTGMYGSDERNEFVEDHRSGAIDVCSFHFYPKFPNGPQEGDSYGEEPGTDMSAAEAQAYIERKVETAHTELEMPVILGEYGVHQFPDLYGWTLATRRDFFTALYETANRVDLNGVHAYALVLDKKFTGETRITDGRYENGIYPDDELVPIITEYGETVAEKSAADVTE